MLNPDIAGIHEVCIEKSNMKKGPPGPNSSSLTRQHGVIFKSLVQIRWSNGQFFPKRSHKNGKSALYKPSNHGSNTIFFKF